MVSGHVCHRCRFNAVLRSKQFTRRRQQPQRTFISLIPNKGSNTNTARVDSTSQGSSRVGYTPQIGSQNPRKGGQNGRGHRDEGRDVILEDLFAYHASPQSFSNSSRYGSATEPNATQKSEPDVLRMRQNAQEVQRPFSISKVLDNSGLAEPKEDITKADCVTLAQQDNTEATFETAFAARPLMTSEDEVLLGKAEGVKRRIGLKQGGFIEVGDDPFISAMQKARKTGRAENLYNVWLRRTVPKSYSSDKPLITAEHEVVSQERLMTRPISPLVYNLFLRYFNELGKPDGAIDVWNHMVASKIEPNVAHYTSLMRALGKKRDRNGVMDTWQAIQKSKITLDWQIWASFVHAMMRCDGAETVLEELQRLATEWDFQSHLSQSRPLQGSHIMTVQPVTEIANAALGGIGGLKRSVMRKTQLAEKILAWLRANGLKPNTETFNIMLALQAKSCDLSGLLDASEAVQKGEVQPDAYTFSTLVHGLTQSIKDAATQKSAVAHVLNAMESRGVEPTAATFGAMISALLNQHQDVSGVQGILDYMEAKKIPVNTHIYTMLFHYHFGGSTLISSSKFGKPEMEVNFPAVEALWRHVRQTQGDHIADGLYSLVIALHAKFGNLSRSLSLLQEMSKSGRKPSWATLYHVTKALAEDNQILRVKEILNDARILSADVKRRDGRNAKISRAEKGYWRYVTSLDLEGVSVPSHVLSQR